METAPVFVQVDVARDDFLNGFDSVYEIDYNDAFTELRGFAFDGEGDRLVIWADKPIYNLALIAVGNDFVDEEIIFFVADTVHVIEELPPSTAFVLNNYYGVGTLPWSGIAFDDNAGTRRYFWLQQSGFDGSFGLHGFEPVADSSATVEMDGLESIHDIIMVSGTITEIGPWVDWCGDTAEDSGSGFYVRIDFVDRHCQYVDGEYVMSGLPTTVSLLVDEHRSLVLSEASLEEGMVVTAFYRKHPFPTDLQGGTVIALIDRDYAWVHVDYFDENHLSSDGFYSLLVLEDAEILYQNGTPFVGEIRDLANRILAVYVTMSGNPVPDGPLVHGIASSRIIILSE